MKPSFQFFRLESRLELPRAVAAIVTKCNGDKGGGVTKEIEKLGTKSRFFQFF